MMRIVMRVSESICQATAAASILYLAEAVTEAVLVLYTGRLYTGRSNERTRSSITQGSYLGPTYGSIA
jgi:hypothetical protein